MWRNCERSGISAFVRVHTSDDNRRGTGLGVALILHRVVAVKTLDILKEEYAVQRHRQLGTHLLAGIRLVGDGLDRRIRQII